MADVWGEETPKGKKVTTPPPGGDVWGDTSQDTPSTSATTVAQPSGWDWVRDKAAEGLNNIKQTAKAAWGNLPSSAIHLPALLINNTPGAGQSGDEELPTTANKNGFRTIALPDYTKNAVDSAKNVWWSVTHPVDAARAGFESDPLGFLANSAAIGKGAVEGGKAVGNLVKEKAGIPPPISTQPISPEDANLARSTKKIIQATQPGDKTPVVQRAMKTYLPELKAQETKVVPGADGKPYTVGPIDAGPAHDAAQGLAEDNLKKQFHSYLDPAEQQGFMADGNTIAEHYMASLDPRIDPDSAAYKNHTRYADSLRGPMNLSDLYDLYQKSYSRANNFFKANPDAKLTAMMADSPVMQDVALYNGSREELLKTIDPDNAGEVAAQIQQRRGNLITGRQQIEGVKNKIAQQIEPSTTQKLIQGGASLGAAAGGVADLLTRGDIAAVPLALGGAYGAYQTFKPAADLNAMVADAFKNYKGTPLPDLTNPKATGLYHPPPTPPDTPQYSRQQGLDFGSQPSPWTPTDMLKLQPSEGVVPKRNWDQYLFPEWEFPNTSGAQVPPTNVNTLPSGATRP